MGLKLDFVGKSFGPITKEYNWRDIVLYALGVGAASDELEYVYEKDLKVLPSFAVLCAYDLLPQVLAESGINLAGLLHGEHDQKEMRLQQPDGSLTFMTRGRTRARW